MTRMHVSDSKLSRRCQKTLLSSNPECFMPYCAYSVVLVSAKKKVSTKVIGLTTNVIQSSGWYRLTIQLFATPEGKSTLFSAYKHKCFTAENVGFFLLDGQSYR